MARNGLKRMLVNNGSSVNILFGTTFDKMKVDHELTPVSSPLYGFTGDGIVPRGKITLTIEMGEEPLIAYHFMEFLMVDNRSAYHGALGRPALTYLWAVTSIHHLCIKFPTKNGITTVRGDQRGAREYFSNSLRKAEPRTLVIFTDIDVDDLPKQGNALEQGEDVLMTEALGKEADAEEAINLEELDPCIIDCEPQAAHRAQWRNWKSMLPTL